jgi:hypothetical protein
LSNVDVYYQEKFEEINHELEMVKKMAKDAVNEKEKVL